MDSSETQKEFSRSSNNYADKEFWNSRFVNEKKNDWYINWKEFKPYLSSLNLDQNSKILNVGSGTSHIAIEMWKDGIKGVVNIDISDQAVAQMQQLANSMQVESEWIEMDATRMQFEDDIFDVVFDKGTLDALVCAPSQEIPKAMLKEMYRVCKIGGVIYIVTHSCPEDRGELLDCIFDPKKAEIDYCQQALSPQVNLVNIMRAKANGKSLSEVMKDPALFIECMIEMKKDSVEAPSLQMNWRNYQWYFSKKFSDPPHGLHQSPEDATTTPEDATNPPPAMQLSPEPEALPKDTSKECSDVTAEGAEEEAPDSQQKSESLSFQKRTKFIPRQNYCFIYRIKKTSK